MYHHNLRLYFFGRHFGSQIVAALSRLWLAGKHRKRSSFLQSLTWYAKSPFEFDRVFPRIVVNMLN